MSVWPRHSQWLTRPDSRCKRFLIEAEGLADLARRGLAAIGDDVRSHGRAEFAVALIDVLNGLLALVFRRQIEIDVRPLAAALAQEALKEQLHANRIDGGDFERIADSRVGRAAAALNQNVVAFAELNDVPDDEEVSGKAQLAQSVRVHVRPASSRVPAGRDRSSAHSAAHAFRDALSQKAVHRFAVGHRIARETHSQDRSTQTAAARKARRCSRSLREHRGRALPSLALGADVAGC